MNVKVAKSAGFCFGVKRAMEKVLEQVDFIQKAERQEGKNSKQIVTYGPLIHNEEVVKELEQKGVKVIHTIDEIASLGEDTCVVIRSHGVAREVYNLLESKGLEYIDATCPFVKRIHTIVKEASEKGEQVIIIGNPGHPEVEGIRGWSGEDTIVMDSVEEAADFRQEKPKNICIVAQTTFNYKKFQEIVEKFSQKGYYINVVNTICNATEERQTEAREIAREVEAMIVIGGFHSSNTRKLFEICQEECNNTYFIQTLNDLQIKSPNSVELVGITAGASTPNNIIEEVQNYVRINF